MATYHQHAILVTEQDYGERAADPAPTWPGIVAACQHLDALDAPYLVQTQDDTNHSRTLMVLPDGWKEGGNESQIGDSKRGRFIAWLRLVNEGGAPEFAAMPAMERPTLDWVEVEWSSDYSRAAVVSHGDDGLPVPTYPYAPR